MENGQVEHLADGVDIAVSELHRFGTDAFLLEHFTGVRGKDTVCDLCAGCGIVGLLMLRRPRPPVSITALEVAEEPYQLMRRTWALNALGERFVPLCGDLRNIRELLPAHSFRLVTCNPPYFPSGCGYLCPEEGRLHARHESEDSCTMDDVCAAAACLLQYGGRFCLCQRPERLPDVILAMRANGLEPKRLRFVQKRPECAPWLFLVEGRTGGKPGLAVEAPLYIEDGHGDYSDEMKMIYHIIKEDGANE